MPIDAVFSRSLGVGQCVSPAQSMALRGRRDALPYAEERAAEIPAVIWRWLADNALMNSWINDYLKAQKAALDSISVEAVAQLIEKFQKALAEEKQIFVFGNGGSAANASHFVT